MSSRAPRQGRTPRLHRAQLRLEFFEVLPQQARPVAFLGEIEPRCRPLGASLRVRKLGATGWGCQCERRPRFSAALR
jgi:hypothetical protein